MSDKATVKLRFDNDTADRQLTVIRDDGLHRHLTWGRPRSGSMRVEVVTWPGYLAYVGDMGSFVFSRTADMFTFFRREEINPSYWAQKVQASDRDGVTQWSQEAFLERAEEDFKEYLSDEGEETREEFEEQVLRNLDEKSKETAYSDIINFEFNERLPFQDWWDVDTDVYTFRFLWCCFAIVRVVELYDAHLKEDKSQEGTNS